MSEIIDIHIHRQRTGATFAQDKLYLVGPEMMEHIPAIFGYAVVTPVSPSLFTTLKKLTVNHVVRIAVRRSFPNKPPEPFESWDALIEEFQLQNWVTVVPMLVSHSRGSIHPQYLSSARWKKMRARKKPQQTLPQAINPQAYVTTPTKILDSICSICPRQLNMHQGLCTPGEDICYKTLNFSVLNESDNACVQQDDDCDLYTP